MDEGIPTKLVLKERGRWVNMEANRSYGQENYLQNHGDIIINIQKQNQHLTMNRKNISHQTTLSPIQLMRSFYADYLKTSHSSHKAKPEYRIVDKYQRCKTDSAQKITQFLNKSKTINSQLSLDLPEKRKIAARMRSKTQKRQDKRSYFKNAFSKNHPFIDSHSKFKEQELLQTESKQKIDFPSLLASSNPIVTPVERRKELTQIKEKLKVIKDIKAQKLKRVRYNFLVNQCYKKQYETEKQIKFTNDSFVNTKERIFPSQV